ncbi:hypothetical protein SBRCBS47491_001074 [Sporothrix bragantina]|uniref:Zn(2)-C6 fungal-type domain-containing protein n=1 Tax=Sporothrix bragantina TaxID=671064 RepID=A0ABP0AVN2_9PEZI
MEHNQPREAGGRTPQACDACRKSKTKCSGTRPKCRRCLKRKTACTWPGNHYVPGTPGSWGEPAAAVPERQPGSSTPAILSPTGSGGGRSASTSAVSVANATNFPQKLLDIFYERHHDVEFCSFLHRPTTTMAGLEAQSPFLAAAIASLAALHLDEDEVTRQCSALGQEPSALGLSTYYGRQATALGRNLSDEPSIFTIQGFLVLAIRKLIAWMDFKAWMHAGTAIRMAHALQLGVELDATQRPSMTPALVSSLTQGAPGNLGPRQRETRRRTFWACFVVDRLISYSCHHYFYISLPKPSAGGGVFYGSRGGGEDIRLPCPDIAFAYDENEPGPWFNEFVSSSSSSSSSVDPTGSSHRPLSRISVAPFYMAMFKLWGDMALLHATGGRRRLLHAPSDPAGALYKASSAITDFTARVVPPVLHWSASNYRLHAMTGQAQAFVQFNFLLHHSRCVMNHEYLPQLDMQYYSSPSIDTSVDQLLASDAAGLPPNFSDKSLIDPCIDAVNIITEMATALYDGPCDGINYNSEQDIQKSRAVLQSTVAAHAIMTAAAVHLWVIYTQTCDACPKPVARGKFLLLLRIIQSWEPQWPVAAAWGETLGLLYKLYEYSYGTEPVPEFVSLEAEAQTPGSQTSSTTRKSINWKDGESTACRDHQGLSYGDVLPDPANVGQCLHDKVRSILLHPLHAPEVKRKNLRAFSQNLWQQHLWLLPGLMGGTNTSLADESSSLFV